MEAATALGRRARYYDADKVTVRTGMSSITSRGRERKNSSLEVKPLANEWRRLPSATRPVRRGGEGRGEKRGKKSINERRSIETKCNQKHTLSPCSRTSRSRKTPLPPSSSSLRRAQSVRTSPRESDTARWSARSGCGSTEGDSIVQMMLLIVQLKCVAVQV